MTFYQSMPWHEGELRMRNSLHVPPDDSPTVPGLSPQLSNHLQVAPLLAIGTLDAQSRPWTTLWGGRKGLAQRLGGNIIGIKTQVPNRHDPVLEELVGTEANGTVVREAEGKERMISGLTIDLPSRKRVKLYGRMIAGALGEREDEVTGTVQTIAEVQLVMKIEQSLGNCPKYLNCKTFEPAVSAPVLEHVGATLCEKGLALVRKADLFFISSSNGNEDMDTNHRGGPSGFIRVVSNDSSGTVLCFPEYSGNRLYQTLGNLATTPRAGLCIPDFATGDLLFLTTETETLIGPAATEVLPRSNLAVKLTVTASRYVSSALPFRGIAGEQSPYNPAVRYLTSEKASAVPAAHDQEPHPQQTATLLCQTVLTPTISRFKFSLSPSPTTSPYKAGQYITLDFSSHLDFGYSHMRDSDPQSINDDFIRTFTVSSPPSPLRLDEFEITIRKVGAVTSFLFGFDGKDWGSTRSTRSRELDVVVKGFCGEFAIAQDEDGEGEACFIAAGVGVTPLLSSLGELDLQRLRVLWTVRAADVPFVEAVMQHPSLKGGARLEVFVTDAKNDDAEAVVQRLENLGVRVQARRMRREDPLGHGEEVTRKKSRYYVCTSVPMRKAIMGWLQGEEVIFEDFSF